MVNDLSDMRSQEGVPLASVIILNYNGLRFAEECLRSVLESDYPNFEVVVVDNGSTDGSYELLRQSFSKSPKVRIVRNSRNLGFAMGNNVGYAKSNGNSVVFVNVDVRVERTWLSELVRALNSDNKVGGAQSKLFSLRDPRRLDSVGTHMDYLGFVYSRASSCDPADADQVEDLFYPDGSCMAFKRAVLDEVTMGQGPFDSEYFFYFEDNDLGWRVRLRGYRIVLVPSSVAYHHRGGSASSAFRYMGTFSFAKNRLMTLMKNYSLGNLLRFMPLVVTLEIARIALLVPEEPVKSVAKLRALLWCLRNLRKIWRKRLFVQSRVRTVPDSEVMKHMIRPNFSTLRKPFGTLY